MYVITYQIELKAQPVHGTPIWPWIVGVLAVAAGILGVAFAALQGQG